MDIFAKIHEEDNNFTPGERLAADYVLEYPFDAVRFSSTVLASFAKTSRSNVVRFCQKLGFAGYTEFRYELSRYLKNNKHTDKVISSDSAVSESNTLKKYLTCLSQMDSFYQSNQLRETSSILCHAGRILVLGHLHSSFSAQQLAFRLNRSLYDAYALSDDSMIEAYSMMATPRDAVVIFSINGAKEDYSTLLKDFRSRGAKIILITVTPRAPVSPLADQVIELPCITRQYSSDMLDDAPTFYLFIELLLEAMNSMKKGDEPTQ